MKSGQWSHASLGRRPSRPAATHPTPRSTVLTAFCSAVICIQYSTTAAQLASNAIPPSVKTLDFGLFWPPHDPTTTPARLVRALLNGRVALHLEQPPDTNPVIRLRIALTRPSNESAREFWNSQLAFPEYDWMRYVRVWDAQQRWLWPNLPYLLRLHGKQRIERYGGVDPGKGVDNDFAAVLIRKFDATGENESDDTRPSPLVSAEWLPVDAAKVNRLTIVHTAQSEEFTLRLTGAGESHRGRAGVWLIYADFMEAKVPANWPKSPEFAGGVLAFFEMDWQLDPQHTWRVSIRQAVPKRGTDFNWQSWTARTLKSPDPKATARLADSSGKPAAE